jgi:hypothetical protein
MSGYLFSFLLFTHFLKAIFAWAWESSLLSLLHLTLLKILVTPPTLTTIFLSPFCAHRRALVF